MSFTTDDGTWFEVVPGKPEKGRVKFRLLTLKQNEKIVEATQKEVKEYKTKENGDLQLFESVKVDKELATEMQFDFLIPEWEIKFNGKELKCTKQNKIMMMKENSAFLAFQAACIQKLSKNHLKLFGTKDELGN